MMLLIFYVKILPGRKKKETHTIRFGSKYLKYLKNLTGNEFAPSFY